MSAAHVIPRHLVDLAFDLRRDVDRLQALTSDQADGLIGPIMFELAARYPDALRACLQTLPRPALTVVDVTACSAACATSRVRSELVSSTDWFGLAATKGGAA